MTAEDFLRIARINRDLTLSEMIARAPERTIEAFLIPATMKFQLNATLERRFFNRCLRLQIIDTDVRGFVHCFSAGNRGVMVP